jgi:serpin B
MNFMKRRTFMRRAIIMLVFALVMVAATGAAAFTVNDGLFLEKKMAADKLGVSVLSATEEQADGEIQEAADAHDANLPQVTPEQSQDEQIKPPQDQPPNVATSDLASLVDANNAFAFALYHALSKNEGNLFYSPYSISLALAMTYAGARGETERQIADTLRFVLSQDRLHPTFNALYLELAARGAGAKGKDGEGFRLNIVNAIWGQQDYQFLADFLNVLAENYGAGLRLLDFVNAPEQSRAEINEWVSDQTEGRIKDVLPPGVIDSLTRLVLTNAIYFNAAWQYPFYKNATSGGLFYLLDGTHVTVPMMQQTESFSYTEGDNYQAIELLYDGRELSMVILLPKAGQFDAFEKLLDAELVKAIIDKLETCRVAVTMPKFEYDSSFSLKEALSTLGMEVAFTPGADFSGIDGKRDLLIQEVLHKAFVSVDEAGTEAAAATALCVATCIPAQALQLKIDRPFIFLIRDTATGSTMFIGRVLNPAEK